MSECMKLLAEARDGIDRLYEIANLRPDKKLLARIDALLKSGGWISVEDRLPEKNTECLVFSGWIATAVYEPLEKRRGKQHDWFSEPLGLNPYFGITHWQSLPPLPQKEGES